MLPPALAGLADRKHTWRSATRLGRGAFAAVGVPSATSRSRGAPRDRGHEGLILAGDVGSLHLMNPPDIAHPNVTVDSADAGRITAACHERQVQFAPKFYF